MKSVPFYESEDIRHPQTNTILQEKEIFEKLKSLCKAKWTKHRDWTFDRWWTEIREDLWHFIKKDETVMSSTKIVTNTFWFEKNQGVEKIYEDMGKLVDEFIKQWKADHPDAEPYEEEPLNEEAIIADLVERLEA